MVERDAPCPHCGLAVPDSTPDAPFCCSGCRAAFTFLKDAGLDRYYELRDERGAPASLDARPRAWLEPLLQRARAEASADTAHLSLALQGVRCAACVWLVERLFLRTTGAVRATVNPSAGSLDLWFAPDADIGPFLDEIARLGYPTAPPGAPRRQSSLIPRLAVTAALAMNAMILSAALYLGLGPDDATLFRVFHAVLFALGAVAVAVGGTVFFRGAWAALRRGEVHLDLPIALGIALSFAGSAWSFFADGGAHAYFDTVTVFIALMLTGRLFQERVVEKNRDALLSEATSADLAVRVRTDDGVVVCPAAELEPGARVLLLPGELLPVRARIASAAELSLEQLNGEPMPRAFDAASEVPAGAVNRSASPVELRALESFDASSLRRLLAGAREDDGGTFAFVERVARAWVFAVLALAVLGLALWWSEGPARALQVAVAILVVTCPCAIGLATPMAVELAEAQLGALGLFVRRHRLLERILDVRHFVFDKTGTLTLGELRVTDPAAVRALDERARHRLGQMVACSNHPKSRALLSALRLDVAPPLAQGEELRELAGQGLELVAADGTWRLGRPAFAGADAPDDAVVLACDGRAHLVASFSEELRPDTRAEVAALTDSGARVTLLSGDDPARVVATGQILGLPAAACHGGLTPEDKAAWLAREDARDTLFLGDGINDALALETAWVSGTAAVDHPSVPARADFYLTGRSSAPLGALREVAARLRSTLYGNLVLSGVYNLIAVGLAFAGLMSPLLCALLMPLSSVIVVAYARARMQPREPATCPVPLALPQPGVTA